MASMFSLPPYGFGIQFAVLARVVEVEHRGDRIDAESVDVILVEPKDGGGQQKTADLVAAVVEDVTSPVGVKTLAVIGVLVDGRAVEACERPVVGREV